MDLEGSIGKILSPVAKHGTAIGAGLGALTWWQYGDMSGLNKALEGKVHMPDLNELMNVSLGDRNLTQAIVVALCGWILKDATSNSTLSRLGEIAQKGGTGYAAVLFGTKVLYSMTHSVGAGGGSTGAKLIGN